MQIAVVDHVTYKITAIYFIFACCIQPIITSVVQHPQSHYTTLGLTEPLNYGLSMPPKQLRREWGMLRHAAVSQPAGCGLIVDRRYATVTLLL